MDNFLQLNTEKTGVLVCGPDRFVPKVMETLDSFVTVAKSSIRNLGTFDSAFTLDTHMKSVVCSLLSLKKCVQVKFYCFTV